MNLEKEEIIEGYAAFDKETGKGLCLRVTNWTNRQSLTEDIDNITISNDRKSIEMYINWFNNSHKKQVEFEIKKVKLVTKTSLIKGN